MEKLEIYDEDTLNDFELNRQNNIIRNWEFMRACGKNLFQLTVQGNVSVNHLFDFTIPKWFTFGNLTI